MINASVSRSNWFNQWTGSSLLPSPVADHSVVSLPRTCRHSLLLSNEVQQTLGRVRPRLSKHTTVLYMVPQPPDCNTSSARVAVQGTMNSHLPRLSVCHPMYRRMAWLLIYNTGEVQTVHMDKRQLVQVRDAGQDCGSMLSVLKSSSV